MNPPIELVTSPRNSQYFRNTNDNDTVSPAAAGCRKAALSTNSERERTLVAARP